MRRRVALGLLFAVALFASPPSLAQTSWQMPTDYPQDSMPGEGVATFAQQLIVLSGGRLGIEPVYDGKAGVKAPEMPAAIGNGTFTVGDVFGGVLGQRDSLFLLSSLPFITGSSGDARKLYEIARPSYEAAFERMGQRLLYVTPWPPSGLWAKTPVRTLDQIRGLRLRAYDATSVAVMNALGAKAVNASFGDAMTMLKDGVLDAVLSSGDGGAGRRLWMYLPAFTRLEYAFPLSFATMNEATYDALAQPTRTTIDRAAEATQNHQWDVAATRLERNEALMRANGVTIVDATPELREGAAAASTDAVQRWKSENAEVARTIFERRK